MQLEQHSLQEMQMLYRDSVLILSESQKIKTRVSTMKTKGPCDNWVPVTTAWSVLR